jgi:hypothetical protein
MQHATDRAPSRSATSGRPGSLSPTAAFAVLLGLLAGVFGLGTMIAERGPAELAPLEIRASARPRPPAPSVVAKPRPLSARRAIARFEALDAVRLRAYRTKDVSLFARYLLPTSGLWELGAGDLRRMRRDEVTMRPRFDTRRLSVRKRTAKVILVRQVVRQDPRFYSEAGKDITVPRPAQLVTIDWTLKPFEGRWLISDSLIKRAKDLGKRVRKGRTK